MAQRTKEDIKIKLEELRNDDRKFSLFLADIYQDEGCDEKIQQHLWRIRRQIEILEWVLDEDLPF